MVPGTIWGKRKQRHFEILFSWNDMLLLWFIISVSEVLSRILSSLWIEDSTWLYLVTVFFEFFKILEFGFDSKIIWNREILSRDQEHYRGKAGILEGVHSHWDTHMGHSCVREWTHGVDESFLTVYKRSIFYISIKYYSPFVFAQLL